MLDHITAIKALLAPLTTYYVEVPAVPALPYVLLWGSNGALPAEVPVAGSSDLSDQLGVTCVAGTAEGVLSYRAQVRAILNGARPAVAGRLVWLTLAESQPTTVDTSIVIPGTERHPSYGVDLYRLVSVPA